MLAFRVMNPRVVFVAARALVFVPLVVVVGSAAAIVLSFVSRDGNIIWNHLVRPCSGLILWLAGVKVNVSGTANVPPSGQNCIVVFNHQSHLDPPLLAWYLPLQIRFIGKAELKKVPVFGPAILRMGHFLINRKDHQSALLGLSKAADAIRESGISLAFAPEGTRSPDGRLLPFKKGAFVLSIQAGLPILPVTIDGTFERLPKKSLLAQPGAVRLIIHPLVFPTGMTYEDRGSFMEKIRKTMEEPLKHDIKCQLRGEMIRT